MDRGLVHKSSPLVGEMGEAGHGWWSVNNLRPPFEQQHHPSLFMPSTTTTAATAAPSSSSSSPLHSFSSLLLSNHYPLPTTSTSPWHHDSSNTSSHGQQGLSQQDSWSQLIRGGLATNGEEMYKEGQMLFPTTAVCSEAGGSGGSYLYSAATASSTSDEIQLPWGSSVHQHHKALQQKSASSPRSSSITSTTSLGSNMLEFTNNSSSPRECISTASESAFKKARTQEPSPAQSTVKLQVRKEKLGDRITALHQLVSPFGKTDTASVLLEAIGYIRFLHSQIEALSSPYVGGSNGGAGGAGSSISSSSKHHPQQLHLHESSVNGERHSIFPEDPGQLLHDNALKKGGQPDEQVGSCEEAKKDLRSRGLCLVPVSCTLDVGVDVVAGPADYWAAAAAPAFGMGFGG